MFQSLQWILSLAYFIIPAGGRSFRPGTPGGWILSMQWADIMDPPYCADRTAGVVMDLVDAAQQVVAMTGDCMGDLEDPANCANDIFAFLYDIADAAAMAAAMASACGGIVSGTSCEQGAFWGSEDLMSVAQDLIGASGNCDVDVFLCLINCVDAVNDAITMSLDVKSAVDSCPVERETLFHKWLRGQHPEWYPWFFDGGRLLNKGGALKVKGIEAIREKFGKKQVDPKAVPQAFSRLFRSQLNSKHLESVATHDSRIGLLDVTHAGPIIAWDNPGAMRTGSAFVLPYSNNLIMPQAVRGERDARRLSSMEDGADGVLEFAFDKPSQLVTLHDVDDVEVFLMGDVELTEDHVGPVDIQAFE